MTPILPPLKSVNAVYAKVKRTELIARLTQAEFIPGLYEVYDAVNNTEPVIVLAVSYDAISQVCWKKSDPTEMYLYTPTTDAITPYSTKSTVKLPARAASTANVNLAVPPVGGTLDSVALVAGNRVFMKDQTDKKENGIYVFNGAAALYTRATDFDAAANVKAGSLVIVTEGTVNADTTWELITNDPIAIGTTELDFIPTSIEVLTKTKAQLSSLKNNSMLTRGQQIYISDLAEPLMVTATDVDKIDIVAQSPSFPEDIIYYDTSSAVPANWLITYRHDTLKNLSAWYDWRTVKFTRWETVAGNGTYSAITDPGGGALSKEFYTFNNNINFTGNVFESAPDGNGGANRDVNIGRTDNTWWGFNQANIVIGNGTIQNIYISNNAVQMTIGNNCYNITIKEDSSLIRIYNNSNRITLERQATNIVFGTLCSQVYLGGDNTNITFGNGCIQIIMNDKNNNIVFGNDCVIILFGKNNASFTFGDNCNNLIWGNNYTGNPTVIPASTVNKRIERGYSDFEATIDINGASTIDLLTLTYCGIINLISSSESDNETIDIISNASGNHPIVLRPSGTLTVNFRDLGISGGNLKLESSPTTILGERLDFIEFEKRGNNMNLVNVRNYLPFLVSP